jgi:hypothetical protein
LADKLSWMKAIFADSRYPLRGQDYFGSVHSLSKRKETGDCGQSYKDSLFRTGKNMAKGRFVLMTKRTKGVSP